MGPEALDGGDLVYVILGADVPFILRKQGDLYRIIGAAYAHGLTDGEAMKDWAMGNLSREEGCIRIR